MRSSTAAVLIVSCLAAGAAGCDGGGTDTATDDGGDEPIVRSERVYLLQSIRFPRTREDVERTKFQFPGVTRPVNQIGGLTTVLMDLVEGVPVEQYIADGFAQGKGLKVYSVLSGELAAVDPAVSIHIGAATDTRQDGGAFDRDDMLIAELQMLGDGFDMRDGVVAGAANGGIASASEVQFLPDIAPTILGGIESQLRVAITDDAIEGAEGALITVEDFKTNTFPGMAAALTEVLTVQAPRADQVSGLFDLDQDGVVTVDELNNNGTLDSLLSPDVDLDGDGVPEHLSQAIEFTAIRIGGLL